MYFWVFCCISCGMKTVKKGSINWRQSCSSLLSGLPHACCPYLLWSTPLQAGWTSVRCRCQRTLWQTLRHINIEIKMMILWHIMPWQWAKSPPPPAKFEQLNSETWPVIRWPLHCVNVVRPQTDKYLCQEAESWLACRNHSGRAAITVMAW